MKLSRFVGATTREVLRQVREALGPDALIVSNRTIGGQIEVVATLDAPASHQAPPPRPPQSLTTRPMVFPDLSEGQARTGEALPAQPPVPTGVLRAASAAYAATAPASNPAYASASGTASGTGVASYGAGASAAAYAALQARITPQTMPPAARQEPAPAAAVAPVQMAPAQVVPVQTVPVQEGGIQAAAPAVQTPVPAAAPLQAPLSPQTSIPQMPSMERRPDAPMPGAISSPAVSAFDANIQANEQVQAAIDALRGSLESRIDGLLWGGANGPGAEPVNAALFRQLLEAGFSMPLVRALVERLPAGMDRQAAMAWARNELITHLPVLRNEEQFFAGGGVYALVGPTGVGKTTTLAKLAARCVAREGRDQVAMLTTDMFRIGAVEQLQIYGRLLGVPTHSVRDSEELKQALGQLGHRKIILIDTTGISQRHRNVALQAALLTSANRPVRRLLVLNAASQGDTLDEVAHSYRNGAGDDVAGCIITKLDEATRIASALDTAIRHRLPIHYVSIGQKVPEDMEVADAQLLVDRALATPSKSSALYAPSEADLAALLRAAGQAGGPDPARRRQMLANALLPQQPDAHVHIDKAIEIIEADPACSQARENWRRAEAGGAPPLPDAISKAGMELARASFSRSCERFLLAVHGKASLKAAEIPSCTLHSTLLMTDRGAALSAPVPQLMLPHGVHAAYAQELAMPDNAADAMLMRARALQDGLQGVPHVHMIEMGTAALWQSLSEQGMHWVSRATGASRVTQDGATRTLAEISASLGYLPAGRMTLREQEDSELVFDVWASGTEVALPGRGQEMLGTLRMVSAKLTNASTGEVVNQIYGLTNLKAAQADASMVARWLLQQEQAKPAFRYMVQAWSALPVISGGHALSRQALYAGQLAAACWQLVNMPKGDSVRNLLQSMAGGRKLSAAMLPVALLKGFAMLEMAS